MKVNSMIENKLVARKKSNARAVFVTLFALSLSACITTREDVQEQEEKKQLKETVSSIQKQKADNESRIEQYQSEIRNLNGKIENLEHKISLLSESQKNGVTESNKKTEDVLSQMKVFDEALSALERKVENIEVAVIKSGVNNEKAAGDKKVTSSKDADFVEAEKLFEEKNWKKAIQSYQKYRETNPRGRHWALSTYKIGVAFQELGMKSEARAFYEEVIEKLPKDPSSKKAQFRLNQIKK
jgi:TolA-binding protein